MAKPPLEKARGLCLQLLSFHDAVTRELIAEKVNLVVGMLTKEDPAFSVDREALVRDIESRCNVWIPASTSLDDTSDHIEWLTDERRAQVHWRFWERYLRFLEQEQQWAPATLRRLDEITNNVVRRFEDPRRPGAWDRRGMVVGQVQSGKTSNYIGLICKAADVGYKLIVVLTGLHDSLRSQTQLRLDEGFLGFDTQQQRKFDQGNLRIGVGRLPGAEFLRASSFTSSAGDGDFSLKVARQMGVVPGGADPVLLVVKKNASILKNVHRWATKFLAEDDPATGRKVVRHVPLLLIDDEADNASVNTRAVPTDEDGQPVEDWDPSKINGWVRKLLISFEQSVYLGYTATPFANIFIRPDVANAEYGEDLFPRSFIINLPPPSNYTGPVRVFGLRDDPDLGLDPSGPLPIIRTVQDHEDWLPDRHDKLTLPGPLPPSVQNAIASFILACAVRRVRGQGSQHNSMLLHVTRFTAVQAAVAEQIRIHVEFLRNRLRYGDGDASHQLVAELQGLWERDFHPTDRLLRKQADLADQLGQPVTWSQVRAELDTAAAAITVLTVNGTARDVLEYRDHPEGLSAIVVGGDKLSRGLTLEGLSVSYYLRATRMYDTLMQMGRWFGYRPGYLDVCRLHTTAELKRWYRDITLANEELLREFDYMAAVGSTPADYGLRVRNHPDGLMVTARAKMRNGQTEYVTFSGTISETIIFNTDQQSLTANRRAATELLDALGQPDSGTDTGGPFVWRNCDPELVLEFLDAYRASDTATKAQPRALAAYIRDRIADQPGELIEWTIALISNRSTKTRLKLSVHDVGLIERVADPPRPVVPPDRYVIGRLVSPADEAIDLDDDERTRALQETRLAWKTSTRKRKSETEPDRPGGIQIRQQRPRTRSLLLLYPLRPQPDFESAVDVVPGFAISFPHSSRARSIEYTVNNVYWEQEYGQS